MSRVVLFEGQAGSVSSGDYQLPNLSSGEILVRVLGCTLCGSDQHSFEGRRCCATPTVLGHEIVGEIEQLADGAPRYDLNGTPLKRGDRVVWAIVAHCGECFYCRRQLPQKCERAIKYGHEKWQPGRDFSGGLAEHCILRRGSSLIVVPAHVPWEIACPASCATATVAAALAAAHDVRDRVVCVLGAGLLGLTACAMAHTRGAAAIVCVDPQESRLELALRFGASHTAKPGQHAEVIQQVSQQYGCDVALEFSGASPSLASTLPLLRIGGEMVLVGAVFPGEPVSISPEFIVRRQVTIKGIHNYAPTHLQQAVDFLAQHHARYPFHEVTRQWFSLDETAAAFRVAADPTHIRVGVRA